jgi:hypothetical protein
VTGYIIFYVSVAGEEIHFSFNYISLPGLSIAIICSSTLDFYPLDVFETPSSVIVFVFVQESRLHV